MIELPARPVGLPDFQAPPLHEVVLGVQFEPPTGYQQIRAREVWSLYEHEYPSVEEHLPWPPRFETFGASQSPQFSIGLVTGGQHNRFLFLSKGGEELIQFQDNRLLHNWRKVGNATNPYPRFESMIVKFESELRKLEDYASTLRPQLLNCNQVEITYINRIVPEPHDTVADWLEIVNDADLKTETLKFSYSRIVTDNNERPCGRLYTELNSATRLDGTRTLILSLMVRGAPVASDIAASLEMIKKGRELIVNEFASITSESAHKHWSRVQ